MAEPKKKQKAFSAGAKGTRAEKLAHVVMAANKHYKKPVLSNSTRTNPSLVVSRVSTGLYGLDVKTNGGFPLSRVMLLYGPKQSGKTTMYLRAIAEAQSLCANCHKPGKFKRGKIELPDLATGKIKKIDTEVMVDCPCGNPRDMIILWVDAEGVWLPEWAEKMGVRPEKVILMRPTFGEQAYDVITAFVSVKEIDITVIDSIAALTPAVEYDSGMQEQQQGVAARMNNKFIRKIVSGMNDGFQEGRPITVWMVNQYREKIGVLFGSPDVLPGGKGQGFATTLEVELRPGTITLDAETKEPIFGVFKYTVKKNKVGVAGGKGEYLQCMSELDPFTVGDIMEHEPVIAAAVNMGLVGHPSKVMYEYNGKSFRGMPSAVSYFAENPGEFEALKDFMLRSRLHIEESEDEE